MGLKALMPKRNKNVIGVGNLKKGQTVPEISSWLFKMPPFYPRCQRGRLVAFLRAGLFGLEGIFQRVDLD